MHLDFAAATADFERKRADGMHPGAIVNAWRVSPPTPESIDAADSERAYTPAWFARMQREHPGLYRLGSDDSDLDGNDQADELDDGQADELDDDQEDR
jgi:hypothetical protein